jgi:hypothetical protein
MDQNRRGKFHGGGLLPGMLPAGEPAGADVSLNVSSARSVMTVPALMAGPGFNAADVDGDGLVHPADKTILKTKMVIANAMPIFRFVPEIFFGKSCIEFMGNHLWFKIILIPVLTGSCKYRTTKSIVSFTLFTLRSCHIPGKEPGT